MCRVIARDSRRSEYSGLAREGIDDVACVDCALRLKEEQLGVAIDGHGLVLCASRHDVELTGLKPDDPLIALGVPHVHVERAFDDEEELIDLGMVVPHKRAAGARKLHLLSVELANDVWGPRRGDLRESPR